MTPSQSMQRLLVGVRDDMADYRRLRELLDAQFDAALRHRADETGDVVARILELTQVLDGRRRERVQLARLILGGGSEAELSLHALSARMPAATRHAFDLCCAKLEQLVRECKRLNRRNCHMMTAQHDSMRRAQNAEACIYAPA
jgi:flagellar biosynthesis protein FlgN